jgi:hypothetical protein
LRALIALEGSPPPLSLEAVASRVEAIEHRLSALEYGCSASVVQALPTADSGSSASVVQTADSRSASVVQTDADLIQRVQTMKASGMSYPAMAEALNAEGVTSATGRQWNKDSIFRLLRNA